MDLLIASLALHCIQHENSHGQVTQACSLGPCRLLVFPGAAGIRVYVDKFDTFCAGSFDSKHQLLASPNESRVPITLQPADAREYPVKDARELWLQMCDSYKPNAPPLHPFLFAFVIAFLYVQVHDGSRATAPTAAGVPCDSSTVAMRRLACLGQDAAGLHRSQQGPHHCAIRPQARHQQQ
jgi:hypothetical protein